MSPKLPENEKLPTNIRRAPKGRRGYQVRYYDSDGKRRTETCASLADARAFLKNVQADVQRGEWIAPERGRVLFTDYADEWLTTTTDVEASTMGNVKGRLRKHAKPYFGTMQLASVQPTHARAFVANLIAQGLAPSTVKAIVLTTGQVFSQAVDDGMIARSPFAKVALPSDRHTEEMHFLTPVQVNALADAIAERYKAAVYLAAYGGLRAGELWALQTDRVDGPTVAVVESASESGAGTSALRRRGSAALSRSRHSSPRCLRRTATVTCSRRRKVGRSCITTSSAATTKRRVSQPASAQ
jgi:integrase